MMLAKDGAERAAQRLSAVELGMLAGLADRHLGESPGARIHDDETLSALLAPGNTLDGIARSRLGEGARAVRAVLFDKREGANWALGWHQDRTIAVRERIDHPGFGPWSKKSGIIHVEPPFGYIAQMLTLRAHLDACDETNAPLLIAPGSHCLGRIPVDRIADVVAQSHIHACHAGAGDVWVYATSIVHASDAAIRPARRRVLHVDYSSACLPSELEWLGV